jgi:hypothetical protein
MIQNMKEMSKRMEEKVNLFMVIFPNTQKENQAKDTQTKWKWNMDWRTWRKMFLKARSQILQMNL